MNTLAKLFRDASGSLEFQVESAKLRFTDEMLQLMERHGVSRSELAARLDVKPPRITALLRGDNNFTLETMIRICRALEARYHHHISSLDHEGRWMDVLTTDAPSSPTVAARGGPSTVGSAVRFSKLEDQVCKAEFSTQARPKDDDCELPIAS